MRSAARVVEPHEFCPDGRTADNHLSLLLLFCFVFFSAEHNTRVVFDGGFDVPWCIDHVRRNQDSNQQLDEVARHEGILRHGSVLK
ncbi:hypothetical protein BDV26DRAFT_229954 [Aspergillus bertholletiae]|uniref:Uncharacterized protein n=1 Tax=Aspergillus bertholletiae TaxID=1226010 RepID=A0A5N7B5X2_9EURO|nr:hypothetical protein BDV26DRAFT_229954 [Aspergillus bertholletiae]